MFLKKILYYLNPKNFFKKEDVDTNLKFMHGINKISFLMFVVAIAVMIFRYYKRH